MKGILDKRELESQLGGLGLEVLSTVVRRGLMEMTF